jgi:hypothetical protein
VLGRAEEARRLLEALLARGVPRLVADAGTEAMKDLGDEARVTGVLPQVREPLAAVRRRALYQRLEAARVEGQALLQQDRYHALGRLGERTRRELEDEAREIGQGVQLSKFCDDCAVVSDIARRAKKIDP